MKKQEKNDDISPEEVPNKSSAIPVIETGTFVLVSSEDEQWTYDQYTQVMDGSFTGFGNGTWSGLSNYTYYGNGTSSCTKSKNMDDMYTVNTFWLKIFCQYGATLL